MIDPNTIAPASAWKIPAMEAYLNEAVVPCRFSYITEDGFPHVMSLWYAYQAGEFLFSVQRNVIATRRLQVDPRCGFEIAADSQPYRGVRGRGTATILPARERPILDKLIVRYLANGDTNLAQWLRSRPDTEVTICVKPSWITSWDFSERMTDSA